MPEYTIINRKTNEEEKKELDRDTAIIGRIPASDIMLDSKAVSRRHAEITKMKGNYFIADLESGNGTYVDGVKTRPHEKTLIKNGSVIRIEEFEIRPLFPAKKGDDFDDNTDSGIIEIKMIKKVLSALDAEKNPCLVGVDPPVENKKVVLADDVGELVIGRDPECQFSIESGVVSRRHAVIHRKWGGYTITDLKSKNSTLVDGKKISDQVLKDGDVISLGDVRVIFRNPQEIDLEALAREYEKKEEPSPQISEEAKISLGLETKGPSKPEVKDEASAILEDIDSEQKKREEKQTPKTSPLFKNPLTKTEILLLGAGVVILIAALAGIFFLLN